MDLDTWQSYNDDAAWVRANRDALIDLGFEPPTSLARMNDWLDSYKGSVTQSLKDTDTEDNTEED